eukprot:g70371.t1
MPTSAPAVLAVLAPPASIVLAAAATTLATVQPQILHNMQNLMVSHHAMVTALDTPDSDVNRVERVTYAKETATSSAQVGQGIASLQLSSIIVYLVQRAQQTARDHGEFFLSRPKGQTQIQWFNQAPQISVVLNLISNKFIVL